MTSHCPSREPSNILAERHSQHLLPPPARRPTIPSIRMTLHLPASCQTFSLDISCSEKLPLSAHATSGILTRPITAHTCGLLVYKPLKCWVSFIHHVYWHQAERLAKRSHSIHE